MTTTHELEITAATRPCAVCDGQRVEPLRSMRFILPDGHPLVDRYDVVACVECGFVYADTASPQSDYDRYYADSSKYSDARTSTGAGEQAWDDRRLEHTARLIAEHTAPDASIVDIGCANGGLLRWLARLGATHLLGIDPSPACVDAVRSLGISALPGTILAMPAGAPQGDCVILSHVLEHARDVRAAVSALRRAVRAGGIAYVEVPDATRYAECLVAPLQDFNVEHINHFSPVALTNVLERGGFRVEQIGRKTIEASPGNPYPALWAIARAEEPERRAAVERDMELVDSIREYIDASSARLTGVDRHLDDVLRGVPEVVVWGTGQTTLTLLTGTRLGGARVVAFADSNPVYHGRLLAGTPVVPPESLTSFDAPILIGSMLHHRAIADRIREIGLPNRVITLEVTS